MTHQCCDNCESRFAIMFKEDSQIEFARENIVLNVFLRPPPPSSVLSISKLIISLKCVNQLLKITHKIKPRPVGLCYANGVDRLSGTSLY